MRRSSSEADEANQGPVWTEEQFATLEREHSDGLSTQHVVELFATRGGPLTEATFRKYVQLGLLPRSVRVGRKGKHRGSQGLYPASVVRRIDLIRRLMAQGHTIQEIREEFFLGGEIEALVRLLGQVVESIERNVAQRGPERSDDVLARAVAELRALCDQLINKLRGIERGLDMRARMARAAV